MNYGPFYGMPYYALTQPAKTGLFSKLFGGFNLGSILQGTQKTLNVVNQIIPVVKQVQPIMANAKTMFKVMNEFKRDESKTNNVTSTTDITNSNNQINIEEQPKIETKIINNNLPTFFM